jgi:hypothetical protein
VPLGEGPRRAGQRSCSSDRALFEEPEGKEAAMNRRAFLSALSGSLLAAPLAAVGQKAGEAI